MRYAACQDLEPHEADRIFYPERGQSGDQARVMCGGCAVQPECLDAAVASRELFGIWGGTSERERRGIRARQLVGEAEAS